jgi:hypothetical protein
MRHNENNIIFEQFTQSLIREDVKHIQQIIQSGCDVFLNSDIEPPVIIYNPGSQGKSPQDSILSSSAFESLKDMIKDPSISGEGDWEYDQLIGSFWSDDAWTRLTPENINQVPADRITIDHNGRVL